MLQLQHLNHPCCTIKAECSTYGSSVTQQDTPTTRQGSLYLQPDFLQMTNAEARGLRYWLRLRYVLEITVSLMKEHGPGTCAVLLPVILLLLGELHLVDAGASTSTSLTSLVRTTPSSMSVCRAENSGAFHPCIQLVPISAILAIMESWAK